MKLFRENLLLAVTAALLCACGTQQAGDSVGATSTPPESAASAEPSMEPTGQPEKPQQPGGGGVALPVPTLPIGGNGEEGQVRQCVSVNWLGDSDLPKNVSILVKKIEIDPPRVFDQNGGGCGGAPGCGGFSFTTTRKQCSVAVTAKAKQGKTAQLTLKGELRCPAGQDRMCQDVKRTIVPQGIGLLQPGEPPSTDENPPTSTS